MTGILNKKLPHPLTFEDLRNWSPEDMDIFEAKAGEGAPFFGSHLPVIQHLLESGIHAVVDIGCGAGIQGFLFRAAGIRYIGIERYEQNLRFGEFQTQDGSVVVKQACWPCKIPEAADVSTCISMYALGIAGEEDQAPATLAAMKKHFKRAYIVAFPHAQAHAQQIWGSTAQWLRPYESGDQWVQILQKKSFLSRLIKKAA